MKIVHYICAFSSEACGLKQQTELVYKHLNLKFCLQIVNVFIVYNCRYTVCTESDLGMNLVLN